MRRMKRYGILAVIAVLLIFTMAVPRALAASVPEAGEPAPEGATLDPERAAEAEPWGKSGENGLPEGRTADSGNESTEQASSAGSTNESLEQTTAGDTAGLGATLDPEKAAETSGKGGRDRT